ncbi:endonuclease/exonuclease/phosphatase family protein [Teladorsagia circumcincta]|uniref:Endonuclease/exonuclease/phosphatase family protein n=1 Tax=Teladorsagia circumcincta TaxID=45464 RepID=A0A2G9UHR0_TELCI|nr:endonuclease/exonuclease/phosphatase family protein [Teladorsagia circumcincta]
MVGDGMWQSPMAGIGMPILDDESDRRPVEEEESKKRHSRRSHQDWHPQGLRSHRDSEVETDKSQVIACTYNCRSVSSAAQLSALIDEARRIKYHVIGLSETKRKEPLSCTWTDGTSVLLGARKFNSTSGGVGFIVSPELSKHVLSVTFHGHRLAVLTASLSRDVQITVIQVYEPTADSDEEEHDDFYDQLEELIRRGTVVVMGDFDARIGSRRAGEVYIGPHSAEERNEAGQRLANFCELHHFFHGNSIPQTVDKKMDSHNPEWTALP